MPVRFNFGKMISARCFNHKIEGFLGHESPLWYVSFYMTMYASYSGLVAEGWDEWKHLLVATPVHGFLMQTVHIAVWDAVGPRLYAALGVDYEGFIAAQEASSDPAYKKEEEHT